jgi:hypothetical protein
MEEKRYGTFEEFWPFYVREHSKKATRIFHFVGTTAAVSCAAMGLLFRKPWMLLVAPVLGYGPAWVSHFFIEKNKPATFKYPLWSLRADFVMWKKIVTGQMDEEVERCLREHAEKEAARAATGDSKESGSKDGDSKDAGAADEVHAQATPTGTVN